jgi:hypothetical protein
MPHAVLTGATKIPKLDGEPLSREGNKIHKIVETLKTENGWLLKSLIVDGERQDKFFVRIDKRDDGLIVHLDDHAPVERSNVVFEHLALIASKILAANPAAKLGKTNLKEQIARVKEMTH